MNRKVTLIVFVSFLVLATLGTRFIVPVAAAPRTIYVDASNLNDPYEDGSIEHPFDKIQEGINEASSGDTIKVRAGTYNESIIISEDKDNLMLIGESRENTIIDGGGVDSVVNAIANNITLSAFTIRNGERGILLWLSSNNLLANNTVLNNEYGFYFSHSSNNVVSGNTVLNSSYGIYISDSDNNVFSGNAVSGNSYGISYGIYVGDSDGNVFSGNAVLNNSYGLYLSRSSHNVLSDNKALNNSHGIYLFENSGYNNLTDNTVSLNNIDGILLYHSHNNILSSNTVLNNSHGIYVRDSDDNVFSGNVVSDSSYGFYLQFSSGNVFSGNTASSNHYGIYFWVSSGNVFSGNTVSDGSYGFYLFYSSGNVFSGSTASSNQYGMYFWESGNNIIFHNNFINNVEVPPVSSIGSANSWNDGVEGNYWSDYDGTDTNQDGIGDSSYEINADNTDNYPLMAMSLQFNIATEGGSYSINAICNSTISNFQCRYDAYNRINAVSFKVNGTDGKGFCRIRIPHALIKSPYTVTVDYNPPLDFKIVYKNGTHTWLYFTYDHSEREVIIMHKSSPGLVFLSQWAILGLTVTVVILLSISIHYYRMFSKQKKAIQAYERELGSFPVSHSERARTRFIKDVIEREEKIEQFKKKYSIKIQPASTLEDLMEKLGVQKQKKS